PPIANGGDMLMEVEWEIPNDDGGSPITGYEVEYKKTSDQHWISFEGLISGTTATITGLDAAIIYDVRLAAENSIGLGKFSAANQTMTTKHAQTIMVNVVSASLHHGQSIELSHSGSLGNGDITFKVVMGFSECSIDDNTITAIGDGICAVRVHI